MKKNRHENLKSAVSSYLKRRNYTGISSRELIQEEELRSALAQENVVAFNSVGPDLSSLDAQLTRFKTWLSGLPPQVSKELVQLVPIVLLHMYIDAVASGASRFGALKFLKRHAPTIQHDELVDEIIAAGMCPEVLTKSSIMRFRSGRNLVNASRYSTVVLQRYLSTCEHAYLMQVIGQWVHFVNPGSGALEELEDAAAAGLAGKPYVETMDTTPSNADASLEMSESEQEQLDGLLTAIKAVEEGPLTPLPIRIFCVMNCEENPIACGALGSKARLLGTGLETGAVEVWSLTQDCLASGLNHQQLLGHSAPVRALCWLGNKAIISGGVDQDIRLWPSETFNCTAVYKGHLGSVYGLAVSPLNTYFASASDDLSLKLWSPEFKFPLRSFCAHTQPPLCLDFHPNGHYLASGSRDCTVRLWASSEGRLVRMYSGHRGGIRCIAFSPDGKSLASAGFEPVIRVWDLAQGSCRLELATSSQGTNQLTWSRDCACLAAASPDGTVSVWDLTGEPRPLTSYTTNMQSVLALHFSAHNLTCTGTAP
ncbi:hypothetical protein B566_EDAN014220 [Ephemera danica]|nr:hypothetical protein B566_EDAN014220 [Ephemera danica]